MCCTNVEHYINIKCASFIMAVLFSAGIFIVAVLGLMGVYTFDGSYCYATGLLSSVLTLWAQVPKLEKNKEIENKKKFKHISKHIDNLHDTL